jgi:hypothetical protein
MILQPFDPGSETSADGQTISLRTKPSVGLASPDAISSCVR